ncbi:MAG: endo alpha-1,4 polygalactosaminidase [Candidatus Saccharimonadales bacterium]
MDALTKIKVKDFFKTSRVPIVASVVVAAAVMTAGYALYGAIASQFFASLEADQGTISGNAEAVSDANASGGKALLFKAGAPTPPPASWWKPTPDKPIALHWVLGDALNVNDPVQMGVRDFTGKTLPEPDVYDIDGEYNTKATVDYLHNKGKKVICYFDAGVYETYRSDAYKFKALSPQIWGKADVGWDNSYWLDIRRVSELEPIMKTRMQMCKDKGFDAIEPDEIDGWENDSGFALTYQDQLNYNKALARWAHEMGMSIGQKGDLIQVRDLVGDFDWTLNEECYQYNECTSVYDPVLNKNFPGLQLYVQANKAVFIAEYKAFDATKWNSICANSATNHFNTTRFKLGLPNNGGRMPCTGTW